MSDLAIWRLLVSLSLGAAFAYWTGELSKWVGGKDLVRGALTLTEFGLMTGWASLVFALLAGISLRTRWKNRSDR